MHSKLVLFINLIISISALHKCIPEKRRLNYYKIKTCFKSNLPVSAWKNFKNVEDCVKFAREKNGLAFNFSPPGTKNLTRRIKNCQVLSCPEIKNSTTLIFDPGFDYYTAYGNLNFTTNATCIKSVGLFEVVTKKKNYINAIQHCQNLGGDLADVMNEFRTNFLADLVKSLKNWYKAAYVGLSDMDVEGNFVNPIGNFLQCTVFRAWAPGHPRPNKTREDCVILDSEKTWRAVNCKIKLGFICEYHPAATPQSIYNLKIEDCSKIRSKRDKKKCVVNNELFHLYNRSKRIDQCALLNDSD